MSDFKGPSHTVFSYTVPLSLLPSGSHRIQVRLQSVAGAQQTVERAVQFDSRESYEVWCERQEPPDAGPVYQQGDAGAPNMRPGFTAILIALSPEAD